MGIEYLPKEPTQHVYVLLCQDIDGPGYVKFGRSGNITSRLSGLRSACPVPVKYIGTAAMPNYDTAKRTERNLHNGFKDRRTKGEWYRFDFASKEDKQDFNDICKKAFAESLGSTLKNTYWEVVSVEVLDRLAKERRAAYLHSKNKKKIDARARRRRDTKKAYKELSKYGI